MYAHWNIFIKTVSVLKDSSRCFTTYLAKSVGDTKIALAGISPAASTISLAQTNVKYYTISPCSLKTSD